MSEFATRLKSLTPKQITIIAAVMILAHLALRAWALSGTWFDPELVIFMNGLALGEASIPWIFERYSVHFLPLNKLQAMLIASTGEPLNWTFTFWYVLGLTFLAAVAAWWMLRVLFGNRPGILIPLGFYLFGSMSWSATIFVVGSLNYFPALFAGFTLTAVFVKYLRTPKYRFIVPIGLLYCLGLMAYSNVLIFAPVLGLIAFSYFATGSFRERLASIIREYWPGFSILAIVSGFYSYALLFVESDVIPPTNPQKALYIIDNLLGVHSASYIFGGPLRWDERLSGHAQSWHIFSLVSVALLVGIALHRHSTHKFALVPVAIYYTSVVMSAIMISRGRADGWEVLPANEPRYWITLSAIATISIGLFLMPLVGAKENLEPRPNAKPLFTIPALAPSLLILAVLAASLYSSVTLANKWNKGFSQPFERYVTTAQRDLTFAGTKVELADGVVPQAVMWPLLFPENTFGRFFAQFDGKFDAVKFGNDLKIFDEMGRLRPAVILSDPSHPSGPIEGCGYLVNDEEVTIPLAANPYGSLLWLSFGYLSGSDSSVAIDVDGKPETFMLKKGLHTGFIKLKGEVDSITFIPSENTQLCVDAVRVGALIPYR